MKILGFNETSHDAALALIDGGNILFAGHAERYSKLKNDWYTNDGLWKNALRYGEPDSIAYYEKAWLKKLRLSTRGGASDWKPKHPSDKSFMHHYSHAAAGYYTSSFQDATIVVLDAIGEFTTSSVWQAVGEDIKLYKKWSYPYSFGLFYSAFTKLIGLKPNEEEYIMMGMAGYGDMEKYYDKVENYFPSVYKQKYNFHKGILDWGQDISEQDRFHIAAAVQAVYEARLWEFMYIMRQGTS